MKHSERVLPRSAGTVPTNRSEGALKILNGESGEGSRRGTEAGTDRRQTLDPVSAAVSSKVNVLELNVLGKRQTLSSQ